MKNAHISLKKAIKIIIFYLSNFKLKHSIRQHKRDLNFEQN